MQWNVTLWNVTGDDESDKYGLEQNWSKCDNILWNVMGKQQPGSINKALDVTLME